MFRKLMTLEEAKKAINTQFTAFPLGEEEAPLLEAYNRVLKEDVTSTMDIPSFNRSIVDGYALKAEETSSADENTPVQLKMVGSILVGEQPKVVLEKGEAVEIVTGAPIPEGADAVVMVEDTEREGDDLQVYVSLTPNENTMKKGADIKNGEVILKAGKILGASEIGVLAALGKTSVKVSKMPIVAVLSTGAEVTELGKPLLPGKIYDINAYSISTAIIECGAKPVYFGVVGDDKEALAKTLRCALDSADIVITTGGVSVGPKDYTPQIVDALGKPGLIVYGVAVKPGKPVSVAFAEKKPIFSLPGQPVAALLMFYLLAKPIVQELAGRPVTELKTVKAFAGARMFSAKGRRTFVMAKLLWDKDCRLIAEPVESGASGAITSLAKADGFVEIHENMQFVDVDQAVNVKLFRGI
ncbi:MAG: molybdopterin-binding protein [Candidatus Bathyarchaeota archaeon]|nr:molybdopterin-binding protein [Candidatus Bathyarchaeota archaeon]